MFLVSISADGDPALKDAPRNKKMKLARVVVDSIVSTLLLTSVVCAQSSADHRRRLPIRGLAVSGCPEAPEEDALVSTCIASSLREADDEQPAAPRSPAEIVLRIPTGTPLRIALDQRAALTNPARWFTGR